ncbi:MAG: hypothetical protein ABSG33_01255 [Candidatus Bathyarchaeia archaeon]|jgi:hypothetical protein
MPSHEEHCLHSLKRYGVRGDDIHAWMDEPSQVSGAAHRRFRHDLKSLPVAIKLFGGEYGDEMVENIFLDHLKADSEEERQKTPKNHAAQPEEVSVTAPQDVVFQGEASVGESIDSTSKPRKPFPIRTERMEMLLTAVSVGVFIVVLVYVLNNAFGHPLGVW